MSTLTVYPDPSTGATTVDGYVGRSVAEESWATIVAGAGTEHDATTADNVIIYMLAGATSGKWTDLVRAIYLFDTSALGSGAVISAATMSIRGTAKVDSAVTVAPDIDIYTSTPAANNDLANADFSQIGSTSQTGSPIIYANWSTSGYNDFVFSILTNISKTGISKFAARNANYDVAASAPVWTAIQSHYLSGYYADQAGTTTDPKIVITYTTPSSSVSPSVSPSLSPSASLSPSSSKSPSVSPSVSPSASLSPSSSISPSLSPSSSVSPSLSPSASLSPSSSISPSVSPSSSISPSLSPSASLSPSSSISPSISPSLSPSSSVSPSLSPSSSKSPSQSPSLSPSSSVSPSSSISPSVSPSSSISPSMSPSASMSPSWEYNKKHDTTWKYNTKHSTNYQYNPKHSANWQYNKKH